MVGKSAVVVMETQISAADLAHSQFLLLIGRGWHRVPVNFLRFPFLFFRGFDFVHECFGLVNVTSTSGFLGFDEQLTDLLVQIVHSVLFRFHVSAHLSLLLSQTHFGRFDTAVSVHYKRVQVIKRVKIIKVALVVRSHLEVGFQRQVVCFLALAYVGSGSSQDVMRAASQEESSTDIGVLERFRFIIRLIATSAHQLVQHGFHLRTRRHFDFSAVQLRQNAKN